MAYPGWSRRARGAEDPPRPSGGSAHELNVDRDRLGAMHLAEIGEIIRQLTDRRAGGHLEGERGIAGHDGYDARLTRAVVRELHWFLQRNSLAVTTGRMPRWSVRICYR